LDLDSECGKNTTEYSVKGVCVLIYYNLEADLLLQNLRLETLKRYLNIWGVTFLIIFIIIS